MSALDIASPTGAGGFAAGDYRIMARVLEGRHGGQAAEVADFFALEHRMIGDVDRAVAWEGVASVLRRGSSNAHHRLNA